MNNRYNNNAPEVAPNNAPIPLGNINQGTVAVEASRAVAEAQYMLLAAKQFPRDEIQAYTRMKEACSRRELAEKAFYSFPRQGETVSGPTIRLAEVLARCWGNLDYGIKELSQSSGKSEMQAYCWDMETNTRSVQNFTNPHVRELKGGKSKQLTSIRDIYENNANMSGRRLRSRILAILPADFVEAAIAECKKTLAGKNGIPLSDRVKNMVVTFSKLGVTEAMIEKKLGHKIDAMSSDELAEFVGIFNSLKEKQTSISDWFEYEEKSDLAALIDTAPEKKPADIAAAVDVPPAPEEYVGETDGLL